MYKHHLCDLWRNSNGIVWVITDRRDLFPPFFIQQCSWRQEDNLNGDRSFNTERHATLSLQLKYFNYCKWRKFASCHSRWSSLTCIYSPLCTDFVCNCATWKVCFAVGVNTSLKLWEVWEPKFWQMEDHSYYLAQEKEREHKSTSSKKRKHEEAEAENKDKHWCYCSMPLNPAHVPLS